MTNSPPSSDSRFNRAEAILGEYLEQQELGDAPPFASLLAAHPDIADELRQLGEGLPALSQGFDAEAKRAATEREEVDRLLSTLAAPGAFQDRYVLESEVGQGGMGIVYRVRDRRLDRPLALKVIRGKATAIPTGQTPAIAPRQLVRFLNEAKITGQLDHPGIVPVHEVGVDQQGRAYFTMKLVKGRTLADALKMRAAGDEHWTLPRTLGVIQRVCEAVAFAHERGVIHRDLKPANVMVGDFGEVYVMDWGLARRTTDGAEPASRETEAAIEEELAPEATLTRDGDQVGTPAYMSPEQVHGKIDEMGPWSDVYSIGAMLYELIAGTPPYVKRGESASGAMILTRVVAGPPPALASPTTPPELIAICQKAMARERSSRFGRVRDLAEDLERFLSGRTVRAFKTGAWIETRKWVERNKSLAAALAAGVLVLFAGLTTSIVFKVRADQKATEALARERELRIRGLIHDVAQFEASDNDLEYARKQSEPVDVWWIRWAHLLVDGRQEDLERGVTWSPGLADVEEQIAKLRARALPWSDEERATDWSSFGTRNERLLYLKAEATWYRRMLGDEPWQSESEVETELAKDDLPTRAGGLIAEAQKIVAPRFEKASRGRERLALALAERALALATSAEQPMCRDTLAWALFQNGRFDEARAAQEHALAEAREDEQTKYGRAVARLEAEIASWSGDEARGRRREEYVGMMERIAELEREAAARRTWRFLDSQDEWWHQQLCDLRVALGRVRANLEIAEASILEPGAAAKWKDAIAAIEVSPKYYGLRLAPQVGLVPIGPDPGSGLWEFAHLQSGDPARRGADGKIVLDSKMGLVFVLLPAGRVPVEEVPPGELEDMPPGETGRQDETLTRIDLDPFFLSKFEMTNLQWDRLGGSRSGMYRCLPAYDDLLPCCGVSWEDCMLTLRGACAFLSLPTEAQWEYGCRAGSNTRWWTGADAASLRGSTNISFGESISSSPTMIGTFRPNLFGLHDFHGNVREWCRDARGGGSRPPPRTGDGLREEPDADNRMLRDGAYWSEAMLAGSSFHISPRPDDRNPTNGLRPARVLRAFTSPLHH